MIQPGRVVLNKIQKCLKMLGPGLVYAGAAIGVSHLVQSTRAGALYSFDLVIFVLLANFLKLPFLEMGTRYPNAKGKSLLHGYQELGQGYLYFYLIVNVLSMFIVMAAISIVTAGITLLLFPIGVSPVYMAAGLMTLSMIVLIVGKYDLLDNVVKYIVITLAIATICALGISLSKFDTTQASFTFNQFDFSSATDLLFLMALIGWMPAPVDISVWQSLWTCECLNWKPADEQKQKEGMLDFYVGYFGTAFLALCFLGLGAIVMNPAGIGFEGSAVKFSGQLVELFSSGLGAWSKMLIGFACLATMVSTTMTCLDAFPRVMSRGIVLLNGQDQKMGLYYKTTILILIIGTFLVLFLFLKNMKTMVDFATILSFLITPFIGWLNWRLFKKHIYRKTSYFKFLDKVSIVSLIFFSGFVFFFFKLKIF